MSPVATAPCCVGAIDKSAASHNCFPAPTVWTVGVAAVGAGAGCVMGMLSNVTITWHWSVCDVSALQLWHWYAQYLEKALKNLPTVDIACVHCLKWGVFCTQIYDHLMRPHFCRYLHIYILILSTKNWLCCVLFWCFGMNFYIVMMTRKWHKTSSVLCISMSQLKASSPLVTVWRCVWWAGDSSWSAEPSPARCGGCSSSSPALTHIVKASPSGGRGDSSWLGWAPHTASHCSQPLALEILCIPSMNKVQK